MTSSFREEGARAPAYRIETERLVLRCWEPKDAPLLAASVARSVDHLLPWLPWAAAEPEDLQTKIERLRSFRALFDTGKDFIYGAFDLQEKEVLGGTGLHMRVGEGAREIGYWIDREHAGQGLATELTAALVRVAFEVDDVRFVQINCDPFNTASAAIPAKLGFTHEATLRSRLKNHLGEYHDTQIWTIFADAYPASPSATCQVLAFDAIGRRLL
jgi:RimJ/RimL family protein N-acetyltransferase